VKSKSQNTGRTAGPESIRHILQQTPADLWHNFIVRGPAPAAITAWIGRGRPVHAGAELERCVSSETTIKVRNPSGIVTMPGWLNGMIESAAFQPYTSV
jgi:hypothetical protein